VATRSPSSMDCAGASLGSVVGAVSAEGRPSNQLRKSCSLRNWSGFPSCLSKAVTNLAPLAHSPSSMRMETTPGTALSRDANFSASDSVIGTKRFVSTVEYGCRVSWCRIQSLSRPYFFQRLLPRSLRHRLGEYYTPDWLAEFLLDELGYEGDPRRTLLDPACGSGTFLVAAISRIRAWYEEHGKASGLASEDLLQAILIGVTGFDLSPLAVMAARTNYLIAVRDLLRSATAVEIPVYLCDSILAPTEYGDLFTGGHGKALELRTSVGRFLVPAEVAYDRNRMASFSDVLQQQIALGNSYGEFVNVLRSHGIPVENEAVYRDLYERVQRLDSEGIDGIWAHIISNSFAAAMQSRVDYVVGNPPWVFWNTLPTPYRDEIKDVMVDVYKLASGSESTMRQLGSAGKDVSALFTYVSLDRYLGDGGKLGFVITQTLFQSTASAEFRRWRLPQDVPIQIARVDDWVAVAPFASATNKTATFVALKGVPTEYPVPYRVWRPTEPFDRDKATFDEVRSKTEVEDRWAHPADPNEEGSLWVISNSSAPHERPLETGAYRVRRGAETGLESAYRVRPIDEVHDGRVLVENIRDRARVPVPPVEAEVEIDRLFPYVSGASIKRWLATSPGSYVVPHTPETGMAPLPMRVMRDEYPLSLRFLSNFQDLLERRPIHQRWGRANPYYSLYVIGPYTFAEWKVVWKRTTRSFEAAVVSVLPVMDDVMATAIPNGKVMMIPFAEPIEAHYVCGVLNSSLSRARINAAISSEAHSQVLDLIELPQFDPMQEIHQAISAAAVACQEFAERDPGGQSSAEAKLDMLVAELWGAPSTDVDAAQEAVAPRPRRSGRSPRPSSC
jgi:SAM-dependent methyltransferase